MDEFLEMQYEDRYIADSDYDYFPEFIEDLEEEDEPESDGWTFHRGIPVQL